MKVFLSEVIHPAAEALLEKSTEVIRPRDHSREAFLEALKDVEGMIARKIYVGPEEMDHAPRLKIIGRHGVGLDSVDLEEATRRGVLVINTPGANRESVAELAVAFMLSLARRIPQAQSVMQALPKGDVGQFSALLKRYNLTGIDLEGKSLGIIGTGRIGSTVAKKCLAAFDMKVQGYDPYVSSSVMESFGAKKIEKLEDMLPSIDFLTTHCPLTQETKGMVGKKELAMMRKGTYVINTARGGIVDEKALYEALESGHIAGAALDVFEIEPPDPADPLLNHPNLLATPHYAGTTEESLYRVGMVMVEEVINFLQGKPPRYPVNPEVLDKI
ncbi:MAG: hydroxyacid dehydrogenase [Thermodesulfobacteriota bacterium]|nr:hydroxyacid dehydrogenase [Thermodesulfobacteriota bacterium]